METIPVPAQKRGNNLGYNGYKHFKGDKVVAVSGRNCIIISPFVTAPGNQNEINILDPAINP